jgi:hypothetical protein
MINMNIFNVDEALELTIQALESAAYEASTEQMDKIVDAIEEGMPDVVAILTEGMAVHWKIEANKSSPWGKKYASAIKTKTSDTGGIVYLDEKVIDKTSDKPASMFANMVEKGVKSWSIKDALLKSNKAKVSSAGIRYIIIPFPVATPRKEGQGTMQSKFGKREMTRAMYKIVKSGGKLDKGSILPSGQDVSGLTRYVTRQLHSQYGIFRVVSEKSTGWQFPGVGSRPVYPKILEEVQHRVGELIHAFLANIVKEYTS